MLLLLVQGPNSENHSSWGTISVHPLYSDFVLCTNIYIMEKSKYKMGKLPQFMEMTEMSSPKQSHLKRKVSSGSQNSHDFSSVLFTDETQVPSESENAIAPLCGVPHQALAQGLRASYSRRQKMWPSAVCPEPRSDLGRVLVLSICRDITSIRQSRTQHHIISVIKTDRRTLTNKN